MPFKRKLLLIVLLALLAVLLWPKGQDDLTPSSEDRHQEVEEEMVMQPTPDTRVERSKPEQEEQPREEDTTLDDLAEVPLSEDVSETAPMREGRSPAASRRGLSQGDRQYLEQRGLNNPEQQVIGDLMSRSELLPQDSMLGGSMQFVEQETRVLNHRWVLATFTDGETQGQALYEFEVSAGGDLIWVLLAHDTR